MACISSPYWTSISLWNEKRSTLKAQILSKILRFFSVFFFSFLWQSCSTSVCYDLCWSQDEEVVRIESHGSKKQLAPGPQPQTAYSITIMCLWVIHCFFCCFFVYPRLNNTSIVPSHNDPNLVKIAQWGMCSALDKLAEMKTNHRQLCQKGFHTEFIKIPPFPPPSKKKGLARSAIILNAQINISN